VTVELRLVTVELRPLACRPVRNPQVNGQNPQVNGQNPQVNGQNPQFNRHR